MHYNKHFPETLRPKVEEEPFLIPITTDRTVTHYSLRPNKLKVTFTD